MIHSNHYLKKKNLYAQIISTNGGYSQNINSIDWEMIVHSTSRMSYTTSNK